jgi:hypothetical protein
MPCQGICIFQKRHFLLIEHRAAERLTIVQAETAQKEGELGKS